MENPGNKSEKVEEPSNKKEVQIVKEPSSPKLEKNSEDNFRKSSNSYSNEKKIESANLNSPPNNNLLKLPLRKFQLDISEMIEKPQEKLIPKK